MGTRAEGPFGNDAALDFVSSVVEQFFVPIDAFLDAPAIDETFDEAFAAVLLLNEVSALASCEP